MSESEPPVVWLMPVKNGMSYITETLRSIRNQTYRNWEVLVWDNGSTDGTIEELARWIPNEIPGRFVISQPLSRAESRAALVREAPCELLAIIDADDVNYPERLSRQVEYMTFHTDVAAASCHCRRVDSEGQPLGETVTLPLEHNDIVNGLLRPSPLCHPASILRRSAVLEAGNYPLEALLEDYELWLRLGARFKLGNVDFVGLDYRVHPESVIRTLKRENRLDSSIAEAAANSGTEIFGASGEELAILFARRAPYAFPGIAKIARHLDATQGGRPRMRSKSFLRGAKSLIAHSDRKTKAAISLLRLAAK